MLQVKLGEIEAAKKARHDLSRDSQLISSPSKITGE